MSAKARDFSQAVKVHVDVEVMHFGMSYSPTLELWSQYVIVMDRICQKDVKDDEKVVRFGESLEGEEYVVFQYGEKKQMFRFLKVKADYIAITASSVKSITHLGK